VCVGAAVVGARHLQDRGEALEGRVAEQGPEGSRAHVAAAGVVVAVDAGAVGHLRVVDVEAGQPLQADGPVEVVHQGIGRVDGVEGHARGPGVLGVQADAQTGIVAGAGDDPGQLLEGPADGAAGAGGVLEQERAVRLVERGPEAGGDGAEPGVEAGAEVAAQVDDEPGGAHGAGPVQGGQESAALPDLGPEQHGDVVPGGGDFAVPAGVRARYLKRVGGPVNVRYPLPTLSKPVFLDL
jgi:hypothetical protein